MRLHYLAVMRLHRMAKPLPAAAAAAPLAKVC